ncbi:MAG: hypothetical protein BroJett015_30800 [Chloroflexota bacterium]|nr:MAG: hypothetical protein BroJett015_30800 [Chloroflexota bacterium]
MTAGIGGGISGSIVEYIPIVGTKFDNTHEVKWHATDYLYNSNFPYANGFLTGGYDLLMSLIGN